ncbi:EAL domain-containing protein [Gammaproteobacteria bacterium LSUCC0112]|nr:EAL domain-containing protein [Gammaproteobacteria bacterium LSUCC0112]
MIRKALSSISFFHKQLLTTVFVNILSLSVMLIFFFSAFTSYYKNNLLEVMSSKATLLGSTTTSALDFGDAESATISLSSLEQFDDIRYAQIYDADKMLFAEYSRPGVQISKAINDFQVNNFFENQFAYVWESIVRNDEIIGFIVLSADTGSFQVQQWQFLFVAALVFLSSGLLAYVLNLRLQKLMLTPINELVGLVKYVTESKMYDKRVYSANRDEIGDLIAGVNSMLGTIQKHESELFRRANYDELTDLPNRHLLMERLSHAIYSASRHQSQIALLFLDLDRFKVVNDSLGHSIGDELLIQVSKKLASIVRKSDSVCRLGGDEFVILLEDIRHIEDIKFISQKIISDLGEPTDMQGHLLHISTSIGVARFPHDGEDGIELLKHADIAMYEAKSQGPGNICFFNQEMLRKSVNRLTIETQVYEAFQRGEFFLMYQPQISVTSGQIVGFEALIRWKRNGQFVPPCEFLPVVEEIGLMTEVSHWVLEQACSQNVIWQKEGLRLIKIAVNLPASFLMSVGCVDRVSTILAESGLPPEYLEIEITEESFLTSASSTIVVLHGLKRLGINIAVDDFGTGYSSMRYLQDLPIQSLKIDGYFVDGMEASDRSQGIVKSIIALSKNLDLVVVAECVETKKQFDILEEMRCDIIQGYLFSKPLHFDEASRYLASSPSDLGFARLAG